MKQIICPKCFQADSQIQFACQKMGCRMENKPQPADSAALDEQSRPVCASCKTPLTARLCPHCEYSLDAQDSETDSLPLTIIGAPGSGKSNFLAVLVQRVKADMGKVYTCALHPLGGDATMAMYDREYHYPLFVQGRCPASTLQADLDPLEYSLVFSGDKPCGKTCNITFYDCCGANFESERLLAQNNHSIYHSKGILMLIDPSQFTGVQEVFKMDGKPVLHSDPAALLARTIHLIRTGRGLKNMQQKIDIPIAVCLSKLDTVRPMLDISSFVGNPSRHLRQPCLDRIDRESCNLEVRSIMETWAGKELVNQVQAHFSSSGFFAFSALGSAPGEKGQVHRIAPHRILDPFLWLLWQNNIVGCR